MFNNLYIVGALTIAACIALGGCGNTVVGIGTDIKKMGENLMKDGPEPTAKDKS